LRCKRQSKGQRPGHCRLTLAVFRVIMTDNLFDPCTGL
jgi:hypothetical protein